MLKQIIKKLLSKPMVQPRPIGEDELQADLRALVDRMVHTQQYTMEDVEKYEELRRKIYRLGGKPKAGVSVTKKDKS